MMNGRKKNKGVPLCALFLFTVLSCATTQRARKPEQKRTAILVELVERYAESSDEHTLRYNPTFCSCPPFEILLGETWARVALIADTEDEKSTIKLTDRARSEHKRNPSKIYNVRGALDDSSVGVCGPSFPVLDFELASDQSEEP